MNCCWTQEASGRLICTEHVSERQEEECGVVEEEEEEYQSVFAGRRETRMVTELKQRNQSSDRRNAWRITSIDESL